MRGTQVSHQTHPRRVLLKAAGVLIALVLAGGVWMLLAPVSFWGLLTPDYTGQDLTVAEAHAQATSKDIVLVDIRRPDEWRKTGIGIGAVPLDMRRKDFTEALKALVGGDLNTRIALICARGVRSAIMSKRLSDAGFTQIVDVPEGMLGSRIGPGWLAANLPTRSYKDVLE